MSIFSNFFFFFNFFRLLKVQYDIFLLRESTNYLRLIFYQKPPLNSKIEVFFSFIERVHIYTNKKPFQCKSSRYNFDIVQYLKLQTQRFLSQLTNVIYLCLMYKEWSPCTPFLVFIIKVILIF